MDCAARNLARCKLPTPASYMRRWIYSLSTTAREHLLACLANRDCKVCLERVWVFRARWEQFGWSDYRLQGRGRKSETYQRSDVLMVRNQFQIPRQRDAIHLIAGFEIGHARRIIGELMRAAESSTVGQTAGETYVRM